MIIFGTLLQMRMHDKWEFKQKVEYINHTVIIILIMLYIYHALINALSAHMIRINLNMIFYTHLEHSPTKTMYIKNYKKIT